MVVYSWLQSLFERYRLTLTFRASLGGGILHEKGPLLRVEFRVLSFFTLMVWWGDLTFEDLFSVGQFPADPLRIFDQK